MLEIKNVTKVYKTEGFSQKALDNVSVSFRECEFASILGPSGSGKTTFLNIIGGLDHYTSGDLIINGVSTKKYKDANWDSYRNHRVGFVFQSYNLISHQTILANVRLALTLSGISKKEAIRRSKKALKDVGLEKHINKRPSQLSGGQMQRVAIARALVNDPDIILADEPTGALDSDTSVQIMELLKKIAKDKLVIMVTHNPELAEKYSNRIIKLKDGKIVSDSNPYEEVHEEDLKNNSSKKTKMSFLTALTLSFNNLMTKKKRTVLVSFAGSIGIIGIALILAVSTGFQNYVDSIQEDTLTSYPLTITQESTDVMGMLLSMRSGSSNNHTKAGVVKEQQYMSKMFSNIKSNDLRSFNKYVNDNYKKIDKDISSISYSYSIDPCIYTIDPNDKLTKVNPSSMMNTFYGNSVSTMYSSFASIYTQMVDDQKTLDEQYEVLAGHWPKNYNEMIIVLSEPNSISDLLVYSLGLRDNKELTDMITNVMSGKSINIKNEPLELTYEDLMNIKLKLINPSDVYTYNSQYGVYEDMSSNDEYMRKLYDKSLDLKIVGVVTAKKGVTSTALNPGVNYRSDLIKHIIEDSSESEIVKKQLKDEEVDVFSGKRFDSDENNFDFGFEDLVTVDTDNLNSAFNVNINQKDIEDLTNKYLTDISNSITTDTDPAKERFNNTLNYLVNSLFDDSVISVSDIDSFVNSKLDSNSDLLSGLENDYVLPVSAYRETYGALLKSILTVYIPAYNMIDPSYTEDSDNPRAKMDSGYREVIVDPILNNAAITGTSETMSKVMTEAKVKKEVLTKVGELMTNMSNSLANAFNIDPSAITSAFKLNFTEDELSRIVNSMFNNTEKTAKSNLISLGYQNIEEPTYISFYFSSFEGKEHFLDFIKSYNKQMKKEKQKDKVINFSDTTGILMDSVKVIVNAVSYVLIAFVSIALVVSSIMIGIITYISVYERTKEIGILRAIGASKKNISSIFNAETFIIGLLSGLFGIGISYTAIPIINKILKSLTGNVHLAAKLNISSAITLIILSIILTLIGGLIPAKAASRKDPVEALRSE